MPDMSIDATNINGQTALHIACLNDEQDIVQLLLDAGSNIYAKNLHNCMPAHLAVKVCTLFMYYQFLLDSI